MCTWPKRPHVCCHLRCGRSINSERWVCPLLLRWGRYSHSLSQGHWMRSNYVSNCPSIDPTGNFYLSYIDPVVIGRKAFHSVDDIVGGVVTTITESLCAVVDKTIDTISGLSKGLHLLNLFWHQHGENPTLAYFFKRTHSSFPLKPKTCLYFFVLKENQTSATLILWSLAGAPSMLLTSLRVA